MKTEMVDENLAMGKLSLSAVGNNLCYRENDTCFPLFDTANV